MAEIENELEEKVFSNDLLLEKIGEYLPIESLKRLRLVSKFWNKYLSKHLCLQIKIPKFQVRQSQNSDSLANLMKYYGGISENFQETGLFMMDADEKKKIPFFHFGINFEGTIFMNSFDKFNSFLEMAHVKSLKFKALVLEEEHFVNLLSIIQKNLEFLESLKLDFNFYFGNAEKLEKLNFEIVNLKCLQIKAENVVIFTAFLRASPNIKTLVLESTWSTITSEFLEYTVQIKPKFLKNLKVLWSDKYTNIENTEIPAKMIELAKILKLNKIEIYLKDLKSSPPVLRIEYQFSEITTFCQSSPILPGISQIYYHFPSLTNLTSMLKCKIGKRAYEFFEGVGNYEKLKSFEYLVNINYYSGILNKILHTFPNLKELTLNINLNTFLHTMDFKMEAIYKGLPNLTKLAIVNKGDYVSFPDYDLTDADITGLSKKFMNSMNMKARDYDFLKYFNIEEIPWKRVGIDSLKNLKHLKFTYGKGLSKVSIFLGFRFLKKLETLDISGFLVDSDSLMLIENEFAALYQMNAKFVTINKNRLEQFCKKRPILQINKDVLIDYDFE